MNWYWRVRIYNGDHYWIGQIVTGRDLSEIDVIQAAYEEMTGFRMLLEGMSETEHDGVASIQEAFLGLWCKPESREPGPPEDVRGASFRGAA